VTPHMVIVSGCPREHLCGDAVRHFCKLAPHWPCLIGNRLAWTTAGNGGQSLVVKWLGLTLSFGLPWKPT